MELFIKYRCISIAAFLFILILSICIHSPHNITAQRPQQQGLKLLKNAFSVLIDKGVDLIYNQGNYTAAIPYFDKILSVDSNNVDALFFKGAALGSLGESSKSIPLIIKAIDLTDKSLSTDPNNVHLLSIKGRALNRLGNFTQAITYFDKALTIDPKYKYALANKGLALDRLGDYSEAIRYYNKALELDPSFAYALGLKGQTLSRQGNYLEAIQYFDRVLGIYPSNTPVSSLKTETINALNQYQQPSSKVAKFKNFNNYQQQPTEKVYPTSSNNNNNNQEQLILKSGPTASGIKVGSMPRGMAVNLNINRIYIANSDSKTVSVIDGKSNKLISNIPLEINPVKIAVNPNTDKIYVAHCDPQSATKNVDCSSVTVIDGKTNRVINRIAEDINANDVAINSVTNTIYLVEDFSNTVYALNGKTNNLIFNSSLVKVPPKLSIANLVYQNGRDTNLLPSAIAVNSNTNKVYVADRNSDIVSIIDGRNGKLLDNIRVMQKPDAIAANPLSGMIYISNQDANRVIVMDGKTNKVISTLILTSNYSVGRHTYSELSINPVTNIIYVSDKQMDRVSIINGTTNNVINLVKVSSPSYVTVNPATNTLYISNGDSNTVSVMDGETGNMIMGSNSQTSISTSGIKVDSGPLNLAINPITNKIYIIYEFSNMVTVIDGTTDSVLSNIKLDNITNAIAVNPTTNMIYVAHRDANAVSVIDGKTNKVVDKMSDKVGPVSIAVNPNTNIIYVANYLSDTVSAIDGKTNRVVANPGNSSNAGVQDVVVDPNTNLVYMAKADVYTVSVINGIRNFDRLDGSSIYRTMSNVTVGSGPFNTWPRDFAFSLAINPNTDIVYAANWVDGIIGAIDGETNTLIANITDVSVPERMAVNTNTNMLYALNPLSGIVYVIDGLTNKVVSKIRVGDFPTDVAVNSATNTIYVSNRDSNTISVIDGKTNRLVTGLAFSTSPPNAGIIYCNNQKVIGNYSRYDVGTPIECEARPNPGFAFSSWTGALASGDTSNPIRFSVSQFGERLNSNFIVPVEVAIPKEFLNRLSILIISVILPFLVTWSIPSIIGWFKSNRQRMQLQMYITKIDTVYSTSKNQNKDNLIKSFNSIMKDIENMYARGKLNDSQYGFLKDKVSDYTEQVEDRK